MSSATCEGTNDRLMRSSTFTALRRNPLINLKRKFILKNQSQPWHQIHVLRVKTRKLQQLARTCHGSRPIGVVANVGVSVCYGDDHIARAESAIKSSKRKFSA